MSLINKGGLLWLKTTLKLPSRALIAQGETNFYERGIAWTNPAFFEMFSFPLIQGDPTTALSSKDSILISEKMSGKYFKDSDPIGQTLTMENAIDFRVTGVFKNIPINSHLHELGPGLQKNATDCEKTSFNL